MVQVRDMNLEFIYLNANLHILAYHTLAFKIMEMDKINWREMLRQMQKRLIHDPCFIYRFYVYIIYISVCKCFNRTPKFYPFPHSIFGFTTADNLFPDKVVKFIAKP